MNLFSKILLSHLVVVALPLAILLLLPDSLQPSWIKPAAALGTALLGLAAAGLWVRPLHKRLRDLTDVAGRIGTGDLSNSAPLDREGARSDEIASLTNSIEQMRLNLINTVQTLQQTSDRAAGSSTSLTKLAKNINVSAGDISVSMEQIAQGAGLQTELVDQTSALIGEVARSIERTSRSAEDAARSSTEASAVAQSGSQLAEKAVDKMHGVFEQVEKTAQRVLDYSQKTQEIGDIVRVITDVAQQTHLLAINATIEAARAGEAGRGFAVVAEEIRQLAENTSRSTERISRIVDEVGSGANETVQEVWNSTKMLSEGRDELTAILDALKNIVLTVTTGADRVQIISRLAREQIAGAEQTVKAIENISSVAKKNASSTQAVRHSTEAQSESLFKVTRLAAEIVDLAKSLDAEMDRFIIQSANEQQHN